MANSPSATSSGRPVVRRKADPARRQLFIASMMVVFGSFMPWISTSVGSISGLRGPGLWTFYFSMLGIAGVLIPWRRVAGVQALVFAGVAIALPVWQVARIYNLVQFQGWMPGPGVVLVFGGGVLAAVAARKLLAPAPAPPA
jgi:hypothetical protein